jgi:hypothetical protein
LVMLPLFAVMLLLARRLVLLLLAVLVGSEDRLLPLLLSQIRRLRSFNVFVVLLGIIKFRFLSSVSFFLLMKLSETFLVLCGFRFGYS